VSISERVIDVIAQQIGVEPENVSRSSTMQSLGADSLDTVEAVMELEEEFDISISDDAFSDIACTTVGDIIAFVEDKTNR